MTQTETVLVITGDHHANSTVGLSAVEMMTEDGGTYRASPQQLWIRACFIDFCEQVKSHLYIGNERRRLIWVINGEVIEGEHHETKQIVTGNIEIQIANAVKACQPMFDLRPDLIYINRGTAAHSGPSGQSDEAFGRDIGSVPVYPDKPSSENTFSRYILLLEVEGVLFEIAHHGVFNSLPWTGPNVLTRISVERWLDYTTRDERPPNVVIRSHTHHFGTSATSQDIKILTVSCPSWQLSTEHANKRKPGKILDIGGWIFICHNGTYEPIPVTYRPPGLEICKA